MEAVLTACGKLKKEVQERVDDLQRSKFFARTRSQEQLDAEKAALLRLW